MRKGVHVGGRGQRAGVYRGMGVDGVGGRWQEWIGDGQSRARMRGGEGDSRFPVRTGMGNTLWRGIKSQS